MTTTYKILGQSNPSSTSQTTVYTVPSATSAVVSTINICNQNGSSSTFRLSIVPNGSGVSTQHYLSYDTYIGPNDSIALTLGVTLATGDMVQIYVPTNNFSINVFGSEIS